jgi:hypothetical protein
LNTGKVFQCLQFGDEFFHVSLRNVGLELEENCRALLADVSSASSKRRRGLSDTASWPGRQSTYVDDGHLLGSISSLWKTLYPRNLKKVIEVCRLWSQCGGLLSVMNGTLSGLSPLASAGVPRPGSTLSWSWANGSVGLGARFGDESR